MFWGDPSGLNFRFLHHHQIDKVLLNNLHMQDTDHKPQLPLLPVVGKMRVHHHTCGHGEEVLRCYPIKCSHNIKRNMAKIEYLLLVSL